MPDPTDGNDKAVPQRKCPFGFDCGPARARSCASCYASLHGGTYGRDGTDVDLDYKGGATIDPRDGEMMHMLESVLVEADEWGGHCDVRLVNGVWYVEEGE